MVAKAQKKVAITGIGIVSPLGNSAAATWQALLAQQSGIDRIRAFDSSAFPATIAAEVKNFDAQQIIKDKKILRHSVPFINFALAAADEALADAGIKPTPTTNQRWGLVAGSGMMGAEFSYWQRFQELFAVNGDVDVEKMQHEWRHFVSTRDFARTQPNVGIGLIAERYDIRGYTTSVHTACASGGQALGLAMQVLRRGNADFMLAGGFDSMINPIGLASFCLLGALSTFNDQPQTASRPFDATRGGFVLGEGAAFLVLETWEKALARGAKIYAELAGEGNSLSSYRITDSHPSGDGAIQALERALLDGSAVATEVDYINAHGTSTKMNDLCETNAIKKVFGSHAYKIPISSTKSQTGHLIAAAGALEAIFSVLALHHGQIPMTMNLKNPDPECDLDYVTKAPLQKNVQLAMSNSFGFGGSNSCLLFRHPAAVRFSDK